MSVHELAVVLGSALAVGTCFAGAMSIVGFILVRIEKRYKQESIFGTEPSSD